MLDHARVAVIGGGVVGVSCLYHLALRGWRDLVLIERDELTSGSTWHAAGNVPTYATSAPLLKLQNYSAKLYRSLAETTGSPIAYHVVGALRLAHTAARMDELHHIAAMARANGMAFEVLPPDAIPERHPFVGLDDLQGALWDPYDGDIDPAQLTQAFAKGARDLGARIRRFENVIGLTHRPAGDWHIRTDKADLQADIVVNAAGYRAGEVMALLGRTLPSVAMSHQYLVTQEIPAIARHPTRLPLMRDPDVSYYLRQERDGFILGPYEQQATPMWPEGIPQNFAFQLWDDDLARLEPIIAAAIERVPLLGSVGIRKVINGPIPYSPDGNPFIGPEHGLPNFFHCNTFSFGIAQAGGAGKCLAEWVIDGQPEWDLWPLDRRRFTGYADRTFATARAIETYRTEYAPSFPFEEREAGRPLRRSPLYDRLKANGARFGTAGAWERALYFARIPDDDSPTHSFRRARSWMPHVAAEVACLTHRAGLVDMTGCTIFEMSGSGAAHHLDRLLCSRLPAIGEARPGYALTPNGRLLSAFTVIRHEAEKFILVSAPDAEWHDGDVLATNRPTDGSVMLENLSEKRGTLLIAGPQAGTMLARITGEPVLAMRFDQGWGVQTPLASLPAVYDAFKREGAADIGLYALEARRLEQCLPSWKREIDTTMTPFEAGLGHAVDFTKTDFVGLAKLRDHQPTHRLVPLILDDGDADALRGTPVLHNDDPVGTVTSGGWNFNLGVSMALAVIQISLATPGVRLMVDLLGQRCQATIKAREEMFFFEKKNQKTFIH